MVQILEVRPKTNDSLDKILAIYTMEQSESSY